jgi:hypothetical protein
MHAIATPVGDVQVVLAHVPISARFRLRRLTSEGFAFSGHKPPTSVLLPSFLLPVHQFIGVSVIALKLLARKLLVQAAGVGEYFGVVSLTTASSIDRLIAASTMTDPVSIVASCLGIASGITKLIDSISSFVSNVQEARRDMNDVQQELYAVRTILLELRDKGQDLGFGQVPSLKIHVFEVVSNCGNVVADMKKLLRTMRNGSMRWATSGKKQMAKLKLNLEAHKSTLIIALAFGTG